MTDPAFFTFGHRGGTTLVLFVFATVFAVMGFGVWREVCRRRPSRAGLGALLGVCLFVGPVELIYATALNGFYEAQVRGDRIVLEYYFHQTVEIRTTDVALVASVPAFKSRWRLVLTDHDGRRYVSATWYRTSIEAARARLTLSVRNTVR